MTTYVFPGQGSQTTGMGEELFAEFPKLVQKADQVLGYSIADLCIKGGEMLNKTNYTQPALYVVSALTYLKKLQQHENKKPEYVAGHSLGEYNALFAAEVFDFETGLKLVQKRGELMSEAKGGSMAAIIGPKSEEIIATLKQYHFENLVIANYNSHTQSVISGKQEDILAVQTYFDKTGAMFIPLNVSGAFHSPYMKAAQQHFAEFIRGFSFNAPAIPIIANVTAKPYEKDKIAAYLVDQITHPVRWTQSIDYLIQQGETEFEEVGPGTVLTKLIRRIQKGL